MLDGKYSKTPGDLERGYEMRNFETELKLPKPKTNFLKRSFKYGTSILWDIF